MIKHKKLLPKVPRTQPRNTIGTAVRDGGLLFRTATPLPKLTPFRKPN